MVKCATCKAYHSNDIIITIADELPSITITMPDPLSRMSATTASHLNSPKIKDK